MPVRQAAQTAMQDISPATGIQPELKVILSMRPTHAGIQGVMNRMSAVSLKDIQVVQIVRNATLQTPQYVLV